MKKTISILVASTILAACTGLSAKQLPEPTACKNPDLHCFYSSRGVVIGNTPILGNELNVLEDAAVRFEKYFGEKPVPGVVISGDAINEVNVTELVRKDKYYAVIPWLSTKDRRRLAAYSIRRAIREQMPDISDDSLEKSVEASLASFDAQNANSNTHTEDGALAHELSHMWFIHKYWPNFINEPPAPGTYGGPAPDWLDEMAAVLAENDHLTDDRWKQVTERNLLEIEEGFYPLEEYFSMAHPLAAHLMPEDGEANGNGNGNGEIEIQVRVVTNDEVAEMPGRDSIIFYIQSRTFADYLIETTGNEKIFAEIASFVSKGGSVKEWLEKTASSNKLPPSIKDLEQNWLNWVREKTVKDI